MIKPLRDFLQKTDNENESNQPVGELEQNINQEQEVPENSIRCIDFMGAFKLKKEFFDSEVEQRVYDILHMFINEEYIIAPHVGFREIFKWDWEKNWPLTDKVTKMHFDFGIYDKEYSPIMFIEVWGSDHFNKPDVMENDRFKSEILKKHHLKLIILDMSKKVNNDEIAGMIVQQIKREIPSRKDYPVYCPNCHSVMKLINKTDGGYFYGCSTYRADQTRNCPGRSVSDFPPLYNDIPEVREN